MKEEDKAFIGSSGHDGGTRPGQTCKKPKDLSSREREERGRGEGGGVYPVTLLCVRDTEQRECGVDAV
jgi:hypothetical protein